MKMHQPVDRQFYTINSNNINRSHFGTVSRTAREALVNNVANSIIGEDKTFSGPFGQRKVVYLDYIASGRALSFIEDYIEREVLPEYGNTHTTTSVTSLQTTLFRHEARDIIRNAVNASEHDSVIFSGSGTTGVIHKLIHALNLNKPPVVFVGPHEHHSNLLPWKEISAEVVTIQQCGKGTVDLSDLEEKLKAWAGSERQLIGSFSAASNVTGILCDVDAVTVLLHKYSALAFWDYATAAPYVPLDMNPVIPGKNAALVYKDAMFFSPHKFVGGINTPGVLIAKKRLFQSDVPHECGGGTIFYVRREAHRYLREPELREEGGTPDIVGTIRAGLVLQLKSSISPELIMEKELTLFRRGVESWQSVPNLVILGSMEVERLPIFSFLVHNPASGLFLHHNYISALLNDLFGIQARGGCACAGPYAMDLLGLTEEKAAVMEELLAEDRRLDRVHLRRYKEYSHREILRPGFTRLNLPYFLSEEQVDFVLQAVALVAQHGWKLLPQYLFNPETGEWHHREQQVFKERKWLGHISYASGRMEYSVPKVTPKAPLPSSFEDCLNAARQLFNKAEKSRTSLADQTLLFDEEARPYRWFLLPSEAAQILSGTHSKGPQPASTLPFCPDKLLCQLSTTDQNISSSVTGVPQEEEGDCGLSVSAETSDPQGEESCSQCQQGASGPGEPTTMDRSEKEPESFAEALSWSIERGYGDNVPDASLTSSKELPTVKDNCHEPEVIVEIVRAAVPDTHHERVTDPFLPCEEEPKPNPALPDWEHCQENIRKSTTVESSEEKASDGIAERRARGGTCSIELGPASPTKSGKTKNTPRTDSELVDAASESGSNSSDVAPVCSDSSQDVKADSGFDDPVRKTRSDVSDVVPVGSESSLEERSSKVRSKKKTKRKGDCVQNGTCDLQVQTARPSRKDTELGNCWVSPTKDIFRPAVKALEEFSMIRDGDRVLVCLSGGKDSLSLLHTMHQYQFYCRGKGIQFELGAVTVDPQTPSYDPSPLKQVLADLGVPYFYESQCIMETAVNLPYECASICSFCSRMKRGRIYAAARREGYNVLALGQHLDDLAESFIMSLFHNGSLRTMKAHYTVQEGDLRVIRPFVYVREKDLRNFAEKNRLPVIAENCPACFEAPKERHRTKQLLASQELLFPRLYSSIMSAIKPVMSVSRTGCSTAALWSSASAEDDLDI